jgi:hypothetical protein
LSSLFKVSNLERFQIVCPLLVSRILTLSDNDWNTGRDSALRKRKAEEKMNGREKLRRRERKSETEEAKIERDVKGKDNHKTEG